MRPPLPLVMACCFASAFAFTLTPHQAAAGPFQNNPMQSAVPAEPSSLSGAAMIGNGGFTDLGTPDGLQRSITQISLGSGSPLGTLVATRGGPNLTGPASGMSGGVPVELAGSPTSRDGTNADLLTPFPNAPLSDAGGTPITNGPVWCRMAAQVCYSWPWASSEFCLFTMILAGGKCRIRLP